MEVAVIQSDLVDKQIKPVEHIKTFTEKTISDIRTYFDTMPLEKVGCPTNGEHLITDSFTKYGMQYLVSETYGNIFISPRPSEAAFQDYLISADSRRFWFQHIWHNTKTMRISKIIRPHLEWVKTNLFEISKPNANIAELLPNQWGYWEMAQESLAGSNYQLIEPLFDLSWANQKKIANSVINSVDDLSESDVICLFGALDRSIRPAALLKTAASKLKPGGLCFITAVLASGFEIQVIREHSGSLLPPERLNMFTYEGLARLIKNVGEFEILEFSTPGTLDVQHVIEASKNEIALPNFIKYMFEHRKKKETIEDFQKFLQENKLSSIGRLLLRKN